jgi:hypothetical protein
MESAAAPASSERRSMSNFERGTDWDMGFLQVFVF